MRDSYDFPYHKSTHRRLMKTVLWPLLIFSAVLTAVIPVIIYGIIAYQNANANKQAAAELGDALGEYRNGIVELCDNAEIVEYVSEGGSSPSVYRLLYDFRNSCGSYAEFQIKNDAGEMAVDSLSSVVGISYRIASDVRLRFRMMAFEGTVEHRISANSRFSYAREPVFSLNHRIGDGGAIVSFIFAKDFFAEICQNYSVSTAIVNEYSHIVYCRDSLGVCDSGINFNIRRLVGNMYRVNGRLLIMNAATLPDSSLQVWSMSSFNIIGLFLMIETAVVIVMLLLLSVLVRRTSFRATVSAMEPLDSMLTALGHFESGDMDYRIEGDGDAEISAYIRRFNGLLDEIVRLVERNKLLVEEKQTFEVRLLYSQFNPHFMFNVLDAIKYAAAEDSEKAQNMIVALSRLLRYTLDNINETEVPLANDVRYLNDYLLLQKKRLGDMLEYEINLDNGLGDMLVPKLILQPAIENCISHGFTGETPLRVVITIKKDRDWLTAIVCDNGCGLSRAELAKLRNRLKLGKTTSAHIGLLNTHRRLRLTYGENSGVRIDSQPGKGTTVTLKIGVKKDMYDVLVVEDEASLRTSFIKSVDWASFNCRVCGEAGNGKEGLDMIRQRRPEIVFTDIRMPVMDGLAMLDTAKSEYNFEAVVLSGYGDFAYAQKAIHIGVSDYLLKPFAFEDIKKTMTAIIERLDSKRALSSREGLVPDDIVKAGASHYTKRAYDYFFQHFSNPGITASDAAATLEITPAYLYKLFKADTGISIHAFLLNLRLARACMLLRERPQNKIYEIAELSGFSDYKYFHRVFTERVGCTPSAYRGGSEKEN